MDARHGAGAVELLARNFLKLIFTGGAMAKLNQIIAVANGKKSRTQASLTELHHKLAKSDLLNGISRTYKPKDEEGEHFPPESKRVQVRVSQVIEAVEETLTELYDVVATQDAANCEATADVKVGEKVILPAVPVTTLLFIEKQLTDLHTFVQKLPTLDPAEEWSYSADADAYATKQSETTKTKKIPRNHVVAEATKEHPAQVQVYTEDVVVGYWSTTKFSGAIPERERNQMLRRVEELQDGVKRAREQANSVDVSNVEIAKPIFAFLFGK